MGARVKPTELVYEVVWNGEIDRRAASQWAHDPPMIPVVHAEAQQREETPDGWCINFEPSPITRRCRSLKCGLIAYYRVYVPSGRAVAGRWCKRCAALAMVRERQRWLDRRKPKAPFSGELG